MPGDPFLPELPGPPKKPSRKGKEEKQGEFQIPQRSMGYKEKELKYRETRKINVKETAKGFVKSLGLLAGIETAAVVAGAGPVEAIAAGGFLGEVARPHIVYKEKLKKVI